MTTRQVGIRLNTEGKTEVKRDFGEVATSGQQAGQAIEGAFDAAAVSAKRAEDAATRQMAKYKEMAKAAREYESQQEHQAKFNAILGVNGGGEKSARDSASVFEEVGSGGMTKQQRAGRLNLLRQGADVFTTASMGMSPGMIAIQQGPQILDALATSGFKASTSMIVLGGAVVATAGSVIALAAAQASYEADTVKLEIATRGLGGAAGMTAVQLEASAQAGAQAGEISIRAARDAAVAYVETGRISGGVLDDLIGLTKRYALTTHQDATAATKELGAAFADPVRGAAELNDKLQFLSASELQHIENLARAGHEAEAQAILVDKLQRSLLSASDATTGWAHALDGLKTAAVNGFDAVGRFVDGIVTGGSAVEKLSKARAALASLEGQGDGPIIKELRDQARAEIDQARKAFVAEMDGLRDKALNQRSNDRQALIDRYNPNDAKLAGLTADKERLEGFGVNDAASRKALKELNDQIGALGAGYKTAAQQAAALARASRKAASDAAKDAREHAKEVREAAEAERKVQDLKTQGLRGDLEIAKALNDPSSIDYAERQLRIQELITQATRDGVSWAVALRDAEKQVAAEMMAEFEAVKRSYSNAELAKDRFMSSADRLSAVQPGKDFIPYTASTAFVEDLRVNTGEAFHDGLMSGLTNGSFLDVFTERLKYAAAAGLADSLTDAAFGKKDGSSSGLFSSVADYIGKTIGRNANGTENWRGATWVGEDGPELLDVSKGAKIYNHKASMAQADAHERGLTAAARANAVPATSMAASAAPRIEFHNHGPPLTAKTSQGADGSTRIDLYEAAIRPGIEKAGSDGTLTRAARAAPKVRRYGG